MAGVALFSGGTVTNETGGTITGYFGIVGTGAGVNEGLTVVNAGGIAGNIKGVVLYGGGYVTNQSGGVISGYTAVIAGSVAVTVVNAGTIVGNGPASTAVAINAGGTVVNQTGGTITGASAAVRFGGGYTNLLTIHPGAVFVGTVDGGNTIGAIAVSTLELAPGASTGILTGLGTQYIDFGQITIDPGAYWVLNGSNTLVAGTTLTNDGTLDVTSATLLDGGLVINDGAIVIDPSSVTLGSLTGTGDVTIDSGGTLDVAGDVGSGETIVFSGTNDLLGANPTAFAGQINGFTVGDTIDLAGVTDGLSAQIVSGNTLEIQRSGHPAVDLTLDPSGDYTGDIYAVSSTGAVTEQAPCFLRDTRIRTATGEVMVQDLAIGDCVVTLSGRSRPITWIGTGQVLVSPGRRSAATPIIVRKSALADGVPYYDLRITKGHSLFLDGVLIPAEFLVNHRSIQWDDHKKQITFYHIELETHDVLVANGAAAESYRDDGNRWLFQNANNGWDQPPKPACAPVSTGGPVVDAVWPRLLDRIEPSTGVALIDDADAHLLVDGARLDATTGSDGFHVFALPHPLTAVHIVSRAAAPQELGLARDPRRLGVALRRIVLRQGARLRTIEAADDRLVDGFHAFEADNGMRWTDGDATLPAALFDGFDGAAELVLHWGGSARYPSFAGAGGQVAA